MCAGFVERISEDGEDDAAIGATDEMEASLLLDELEWAGHTSGAVCVATRSIHGSRWRIKIKVEANSRNLDLYQIGTEAAEGERDGFGSEFAAIGVAAQAQGAEDRGAAA